MGDPEEFNGKNTRMHDISWSDRDEFDMFQMMFNEFLPNETEGQGSSVYGNIICIISRIRVAPFALAVPEFL